MLNLEDCKSKVLDYYVAKKQKINIKISIL